MLEHPSKTDDEKMVAPLAAQEADNTSLTMVEKMTRRWWPSVVAPEAVKRLPFAMEAEAAPVREEKKMAAPMVAQKEIEAFPATVNTGASPSEY